MTVPLSKILQTAFVHIRSIFVPFQSFIFIKLTPSVCEVHEMNK